MSLKKIDLFLKNIEEDFNIYDLLIPSNREFEKKKFFSFYKNKKEYNPFYKYKTRDFSKLKLNLETLLKKIVKDGGIRKLFKEKIKNMIMKINLVKSENEDFNDICRKLYGVPETKIVVLSRKILENKYNNVLPEEQIKSSVMVEILKKELKKHKINWRVVETSKILPKISISPSKETVFVNTNYKYTKEEMNRLKVHEMVHIFRSINGQKQPWNIFRTGFANYEETEEGLAVYTEDIKGKLKTDFKQLKIYAGRVLAVDISLKNSFYETFWKLKKYFSDTLAYRLTERAKRGIKDTSIPGAFTKGYYYMSGWQKVSKYLENGGSLLSLYLGKVKIEDIDIIEDLFKENILLKPDFIFE